MKERSWNKPQIIGILIIMLTLMAAVWVGQSSGMEVQKLYPADDETIEMVVKAMRHDSNQTVTIVAYVGRWTDDATDKFIPKAFGTLKKLQKQRIQNDRITLSFTDASGLADYGVKTALAEGIYLYLD